MINPEFFIKKLAEHSVDFFTGVPDSLLKNICAYISDNMDDAHNVIAANEGSAMGLAAGYHLATGKVPVVYMQNSGQGNIVNPLLSLADAAVYKIPMLLLIGWRGEPGVKDEPQHVTQGRLTLPLLDTLEVPYVVLSDSEEECAEQIEQVLSAVKKSGRTHALVVRKNLFGAYAKKSSAKSPDFELSREEAIKTVIEALGASDAVVSTTGMISREVFEIREARGEDHSRDFLTVGAMGHASQIAMGIAMQQPGRRVWCFDGDGAVLMHMGSLAIIGSRQPKNLIHVVFNNGAHDSVGGQPTVGLKVSVPAIASACGYKHVYSVSDDLELKSVLKEVPNLDGTVLLEVQVKKGARPDLGRPTTTPIQNKESLMQFLAK